MFASINGEGIATAVFQEDKWRFVCEVVICKASEACCGGNQVGHVADREAISEALEQAAITWSVNARVDASSQPLKKV